MHSNKDNKQINNLPDFISFQEWQWSVPLVQTLLKHNRDICCRKDIKIQRLTIYFNCRKCNWVSGRTWRRANLRSITNQIIKSSINPSPRLTSVRLWRWWTFPPSQRLHHGSTDIWPWGHRGHAHSGGGPRGTSSHPRARSQWSSCVHWSPATCTSAGISATCRSRPESPGSSRCICLLE